MEKKQGACSLENERPRGAATSPLGRERSPKKTFSRIPPFPYLFLCLFLFLSSPDDPMTAASFSRRSWSETAGRGTAASGEAGLCVIDAVVVEVERGVDAPVTVAVEWADESYSLPEARIMTTF